MKIKEPHIEKNVFDEDYFNYLKEYFSNHEILKKDEYHFYGSKRVDSFADPVLKEALEKLTDKAKKIFESDTLIPTYSIFSEYSGTTPYLDEHKDAGPCTYTIDLSLYQGTQWPLYIEGKAYNWFDNEGIFFYPNDQIHWKEEFPDKENNKVGLMFFHYVEPDHWWWSIPEKMRPILRNKVYPTKPEDKPKVFTEI